METIIPYVGLVLLLMITINIIVVRYIIKKSYYLSKNEVSILNVALRKQKGLVNDKKYHIILRKLNSKI